MISIPLRLLVNGVSWSGILPMIFREPQSCLILPGERRPPANAKYSRLDLYKGRWWQRLGWRARAIELLHRGHCKIIKTRCAVSLEPTDGEASESYDRYRVGLINRDSRSPMQTHQPQWNSTTQAQIFRLLDPD